MPDGQAIGWCLRSATQFGLSSIVRISDVDFMPGRAFLPVTTDLEPRLGVFFVPIVHRLPGYPGTTCPVPVIHVR